MRNELDNDEDSRPFSPDTLDELSKRIEKVRMDCLLEIDGAGAEGEAEQHYLLALSSLEQAQRHARLAAIKQTRALA